jgi:hypothetical protein
MKQVLTIIKEKKSSSFIILWIACIFGSLAVLPYLIFLSKIRLTSVQVLGYFVQNAFMYAIACAGGLYFSHKVGFRLILDEKNGLKRLKNFLFTAVPYGLFVGVTILFFESMIFALPLPVISPPWYLGLLASFYGAINEEVMTRLFLLSLLVWGLQKIFKSNSEKWKWIGIIVVALLFGIGHLPTAMQVMKLTPFLVFRILFLNGIAGVTFGYLFWKYSLETSILSHFLADVILHVFYTK